MIHLSCIAATEWDGREQSLLQEIKNGTIKPLFVNFSCEMSQNVLNSESSLSSLIPRAKREVLQKQGKTITIQEMDWNNWRISPNLIQGAQVNFSETTIGDILEELKKMRIAICGSVHTLPNSPFRNSCPMQAYNLACKHSSEKSSKVHELFLIGLWLMSQLFPEKKQEFIDGQMVLGTSFKKLIYIDTVMHLQTKGEKPQFPLPESHHPRLRAVSTEKYESLEKKQERLMAVSKEIEKELAETRMALRDMLVREITLGLAR